MTFGLSVTKLSACNKEVSIQRSCLYCGGAVIRVLFSAPGPNKLSVIRRSLYYRDRVYTSVCFPARTK